MARKTPNIGIRGIRTSIPPGYVLGRLDNGEGPVQLIPYQNLGAAMAASGSVGGPGAVGSPQTPGAWHLGVVMEGPFASQEQFQLPASPIALTMPGSDVHPPYAGFPPINDTSLILTDDPLSYWYDGSGAIATITWLAGQKNGSIAWSNPVTVLPQYTHLWLLAPITPDPTLADVCIILHGDA